ncbi:uncharacterized protein N7482_001233 [Penicillium canariense]|uniref:Uncharacterized protein n=1 Tax=Penicillium canariense TaxID=189055 RepID=A0A9W9LSW3_9EURO|nr:uncharacterized protein N7482_001233 [Penicillium canariense]KAJ5175356.1 hypothetical protein N7482_001233 [Penicillium canariense]
MEGVDRYLKRPGRVAKKRVWAIEAVRERATAYLRQMDVRATVEIKETEKAAEGSKRDRGRCKGTGQIGWIPGLKGAVSVDEDEAYKGKRKE